MMIAQEERALKEETALADGDAGASQRRQIPEMCRTRRSARKNHEKPTSQTRESLRRQSLNDKPQCQEQIPPSQPSQTTQKNQFQMICSSLVQLNEQIKTISLKVQSFDNRISRLQFRANDINDDRRKPTKGHYQCPNKACRKTYDTEASLNLHYKLKHSGSDFENKLDRYLKQVGDGESTKKTKKASMTQTEPKDEDADI